MQDGATSLFLASQNGHAKIVSLILSTVASANENNSSLSVEEMINVRRLDGATPLWMAAQMGFDYVVRLLLRAGANPNIIRNVKDIRRSIFSLTINAYFSLFRAGWSITAFESQPKRSCRRSRRIIAI